MNDRISTCDFCLSMQKGDIFTVAVGSYHCVYVFIETREGRTIDHFEMCLYDLSDGMYINPSYGYSETVDNTSWKKV